MRLRLSLLGWSINITGDHAAEDHRHTYPAHFKPTRPGKRLMTIGDVSTSDPLTRVLPLAYP
jgi:hypothetical protein